MSEIIEKIKNNEIPREKIIRNVIIAVIVIIVVIICLLHINSDYKYIFDFKLGGVVITGYKIDPLDIPTDFEIPSHIYGMRVKGIGKRAFYGYDFTKVTLPDGLVKIGNYAFEWCDRLEEINIPDSIKIIGKGAFTNCHNIKSIYIPDGVTRISAFTFNICYSLKEIRIPDSVESIGVGAFSGCRNLEEIKVPYGVELLNQDVFSGCSNLETVILPDTIVYISPGGSSFRYCKNAVVIYKGVKYKVSDDKQMDLLYDAIY